MYGSESLSGRRECPGATDARCPYAIFNLGNVGKRDWRPVSDNRPMQEQSDTETDTWSALASMGWARDHLAVAVAARSTP